MGRMDISISALSVRYSYAAVLRYMAVLQDEFIYGGHLTALGAPSKVLLVSILLNIQISLPLLPILYLAPLIVYNVDYYKSLEKDMATNPCRTSYLARKAGLYKYLIAFYAVLLIVSLALFADRGLIMLILALALSGVMYATVFKIITKKIPGFKNVFTSGIWASGVVFSLISYYSLPFDAFFGLVFMFLFMRSFGNVIFFDLKDVMSDAVEGLKTIPVLLGKERTVALLQAMNIISFLPIVIGVCLQKVPAYALSMIALAFFTFYNLRRAGTVEARRLGYAYYMLADAETLLWPIILLMGKAVYYSL